MKKIFVYAFALALMVSCGGSGSKSTAYSSSNTEQNEKGGEGMDDEEGGLDMLMNVAKKAKSMVDSDDEDEYEYEEAGVTMKVAGAVYKGAGKMMQEHGDEDDKQRGKVLERAGDAFSAFGDLW